MAGQAPPDWRNKIMHATLRVGENLLYGADSPPDHYRTPQGFAVALETSDPAEADRIFNALADGAAIQMPMQETFWAKRFGMLTDRFGTPWTINCGNRTS
jgi:PhnB protein